MTTTQEHEHFAPLNTPIKELIQQITHINNQTKTETIVTTKNGNGLIKH